MRSLSCTLAALGLLSCLTLPVGAELADAPDFSGFESLSGVCLSELPQSGRLCLDSRTLRSGDILTGQQAAQMIFLPDAPDYPTTAVFSYFPITGSQVGRLETMSFSIRGKKNQAPVAEDSAMETYKNLPATALLKCTDPEGEKLSFTLTRPPRRGSVTLNEDGTFTYTPKHNKVGIDSFTYTAADPAGNVSREATVTVTILKPTDAAQYTDTQGQTCRFAAEWMRHTGIFSGEQVGKVLCFSPERTVSRGEFVTMLVKTLDIPVDEGLTYTGYTDEIPTWLQPYLAAAVRAGVTMGLPDPEIFAPQQPITEAEAALMLQNALSCQTFQPEDQPLTRAKAATILYGAGSAG